MNIATPLVSAILSGILGYSSANYLNSNEKIVEKKFDKKQVSSETNKGETHKIYFPIKQLKTEQAVVPILQNITINPYCNVMYSKWHRAPLLVHQYLTESMFKNKQKRERPDYFEDNRISQEYFRVKQKYYSDADYNKTYKFDVGHMASNANYSGVLEQYQGQTYSFANLLPQNSHLNQHYWKQLQQWGRTLLQSGKCKTSLQVFSGPIFLPQKRKEVPSRVKQQAVYDANIMVIGKQGVMVPHQFYKIYKCVDKSGTYLSGFIIDNAQPQGKHAFSQHQVPISEIQRKTGLQFTFPSITGSLVEHDPSGSSKLYA